MRSASTSSSSTSWTPKPVRRRASGLPRSPYPSCDACRLRRVRCVRKEAASPCEPCLARQIKCTSKRAEQRGVADIAVNDGPSDSATLVAQTVDFADLVQTMRRPLSRDSTDGRLLSVHESESMMATLMDTYIVGGRTFGVPLLRWQRLRQLFQDAGLRLKQLDVNTETMVLACIAFGALETDHPRLVGPDCPRVADIGSAASRDLAPFARNRRPVCEDTVGRVLWQVDTRGAFKVASMESVMLLGLASELRTQLAGEYQFEAERPYLAVQLAHLLHLTAVCPSVRHDLQGAVEFFLCIKDAFRSGYTGHRLLVSDEVVQLFMARYERSRQTPVEESIALASPDADLYLSVSQSRWLEVLHLGRSIATSLSIPIRRRQPIAVSTFQTVLAVASDLERSVSASRHNILASQAILSPEILQAQNEAATGMMDAELASGPTSMLSLSLFVLKDWMVWRSTQMSPDDDAGPIADVDRSVIDMLARGVLALADMIEATDRMADVFSHLAPFPFVRFKLPNITMRAISLPCAELGGPAFFPRSAQVRAVVLLIRGIRAQSFVWAERADDARRCEAALDRLLREHAVPPPVSMPTNDLWHAQDGWAVGGDALDFGGGSDGPWSALPDGHGWA